ncbi:MAG: methyltransferase [Hyphomicrobiales bacterium]|nr:methyltransferase [Hyphomicrobiales bacterium]
MGARLFSSWIERLRDLRNRKVSDPAFRRWATRFALTRPIARRQAKALFDITAGFVYSQVLSACVRVDLFEILQPGPADTHAIAQRINLPLEGSQRLLKAAAALELVECRGDGRYALGPLGAALVGNAGVKAMIQHHDILYDDLRDPLALLAGRTDAQLKQYWAYAGGERSRSGETWRHTDYTRLMAASQAFVTSEILGAYSFARHRRLLDVGGGDGTFLIAAGQAAPQLELTLFDLPPVAAIARQRILAAGMAGRARAFAGSFLADDLPPGADLVTLNRVLHDHDDAGALSVLGKIRDAMAPRGTLLIAEPMAGTRGARASGDAYFGFYLLAMGQGRPRTTVEIKRMLDSVGFSRVREVRTSTPLIARIIAAQRPAD